MKKTPRIPSLRLHKPSGRAVVTIDGKDIYLGKHGTAAATRDYHRRIAEWLDRQNNAAREEHAAAVEEIGLSAEPIAVVEIVADYWKEHVTVYYRRDGKPTSEQHSIKSALRFLAPYDNIEAKNFGPLKLKAVRQAMIDAGLSRKNINGQVDRIRRMFKWAESEERVPAGTYDTLKTVAGLRAGRSKAREPKPKRPVADAHVEAVRPFVSRQVWAMIEVQRLSGCRPGEVVLMRPIDLDTSGTVWTFTPAEHKTEHHGHKRTIYLGPCAQEIIRPFLDRPTHAYLFSPAEADAERRDRLHSRRSTPLSCGNRPGTNRRRSPKRKPGDRYTTTAYRKAIAVACDRAFPAPEHLQPRIEERMMYGKVRKRRETIKRFLARLTAAEREELAAWRESHRWHPHQLRHGAATMIRREFGEEFAKAVLGHAKMNMTEHYGEKDRQKAIAVIGKVG